MSRNDNELVEQLMLLVKDMWKLNLGDGILLDKKDPWEAQNSKTITLSYREQTLLALLIVATGQANMNEYRIHSLGVGEEGEYSQDLRYLWIIADIKN